MGLVYSTNHNLNCANEEQPKSVTLPPSSQRLIVCIDRRNRSGKQVTLIKGFVGNSDDLTTLSRTLKSKCGVGGSAKDGEILIQGDFRDKAVDILSSMGYGVKRGN